MRTRTYGVVGIMPASFQFPNRNIDLWEPSPLDAPFEVIESLHGSMSSAA